MNQYGEYWIFGVDMLALRSELDAITNIPNKMIDFNVIVIQSIQYCCNAQTRIFLLLLLYNFFVCLFCFCLMSFVYLCFFVNFWFGGTQSRSNRTKYTYSWQDTSIVYCCDSWGVDSVDVRKSMALVANILLWGIVQG